MTREGSAISGAPYHLKPADFWDLKLGDFPDADIGDVAWVLHHRESTFMQQLEADIRERCVREPVDPYRWDAVPGVGAQRRAEAGQ